MLKCFGENDRGQLGLKHNDNQLGVANIDSFPNISSIHCGGDHNFILTRKKTFNNIFLKLNELIKNG